MTVKEKIELKDGVISIFKRFNILDHTATIGWLRDDILRYIDSLQEEPVSEVWHDANETPKGDGDKKILVQFTDSHASVLEIDDWEYLDHQTKWAYLKDLT